MQANISISFERSSPSVFYQRLELETDKTPGPIASNRSSYELCRLHPARRALRYHNTSGSFCVARQIFVQPNAAHASLFLTVFARLRIRALRMERDTLLAEVILKRF